MYMYVCTVADVHVCLYNGTQGCTRYSSLSVWSWAAHYLWFLTFRMLFSYVAKQRASGSQLVVTYIVTGVANKEVG